MKDAEMESTKALGNHLVIEEANILAECQRKETSQRERMFWEENIERDKTTLLKEVERENKTISETQAKGVAKIVSKDTKRTKATE